MIVLTFTLLLNVISIFFLQDDALIVELPEGIIQGHIMQSQNGIDYYGFHEVPYAAPPVGSNRFQQAKDVEPWEGILNATQNTKVCYQFGVGSNNAVNPYGLSETEDCLYLNIYSPVKPGSQDLLPVFFWVHGGGFSTGTGVSVVFSPKLLMDYNIVVVTINYRLGPFGFLSTMDGVVPGNLGLKDQKKALEWLKPRISLFGGDPKKITIAGESAGAMSVGFLLVGQGMEGLFRGAIQQSGTSASRIITKSAKNYAFQLGSNLNNDFTSCNSSTELLNLLQSVSAEDIRTATQNITLEINYSLGLSPDVIWLPVIESDKETDPLITGPILDSFSKGNFNQVPILLGFNSEESIVFYASIDYDWQLQRKSALDADPRALVSSPTLNVAKCDLLKFGKKLKLLYTNDSFSTDEGAFLRLSTDAVFTNGILKQAQVTSCKVPVYLYQFSYVGFLGSIFYPNFTRPIVPGAERVGHSEQLAYIWSLGIDLGDDSELSTRLLTLFTNFVKYLNPTPQEDDLLDNIIWSQVDNSAKLKYLNINNTLSMDDGPRIFTKVDKLFQKYLIPPYETY